MASVASFDIVSDFDQQELKNALDQVDRELRTRFDLKDTKTTVELGDNTLTITTDSEMTLNSVRDLIESKFHRRGLSLKILDYQTEEPASGGRVRQLVKLRRGIPEDLAKQISKRIRDDFKKVTPQIQGNAVRVQGKNRDDLQAVIQALKEDTFPVALQFENYR
ncbi:MAG: YajQ family cyclic di-GMP-binding protein [Chloroflexota bacterium]|nr:YajQ family cyclic di-GMP-binding protein [Chloroflexota bacterium]